MCDIPSIAVFCSESVECFPGTASKFFLKLLVTIPVAPIITDILLLLLLLLLRLAFQPITVILTLVQTKQIRIKYT